MSCCCGLTFGLFACCLQNTVHDFRAASTEEKVFINLPVQAGTYKEMSVATSTDPTGAQIDTDAFKKLYPQQFFKRFYQEGVRPDGRTLGRSRAVSLGMGAISNALGSCLTKLGSTIVLAGVKGHAGEAAEGKPNCGVFRLNVELAPFATIDARSNQSLEMLAKVTQRLANAITPLQIEQQLGIKTGKTAFHIFLDIYILNADGSVLDAALLAAIAALMDTKLPRIKAGKEDSTEQDVDMISAADHQDGTNQKRKQLELSHFPVAVTCALSDSHVLVDPTAEEESIADSSVCVVLDKNATLHGVYKAGGTVMATPMTYTRCIEAAKMRYKEVFQLLQDAVQDAEEQ